MIFNPIRWSTGRLRTLGAFVLTIDLIVSGNGWWPLIGLCLLYLWFAFDNESPSPYAGLDVEDIIALERKEERLYRSRKAERAGDLGEAGYWRRRAGDDF